MEEESKPKLGNIEEVMKLEEKRRKKKRRKKEFIAFLIMIIIVVGLYFATTIVKKKNIEKLGNDYCQYNGEHPIETGMKGDEHNVCIGCSKIMKFEYKTIDQLCETCAKELHRCKQCGKLLQD